MPWSQSLPALFFLPGKEVNHISVNRDCFIGDSARKNMNYSYGSKLLRHGFMALLVGLVGGFLFTFSLIGGVSFSPLPVAIEMDIPGTTKGWRVLHVGMLMNGLMAIAVALAMHDVSLSPRVARRVYVGTAIAVWGNFSFYFFGMFAPNRGLTAGGNQLGEASVAGVLAFFPAILSAATLIYVCWIMFRADPLPEKS
jgi:hypothetical protein